jgi:peptide chain release factor 1
MFDRLQEMENRYRALGERLGQPGTASDPTQLRELGREMAELREAVETYERWKQVATALEHGEALLEDADPEIRELARAEVAELRTRRAALEEELRQLLVPKDPDDDRDVVLEIRGGTGGEEAALFAADLFRMYSRYAERRGWRIEPLSLSGTGSGGIKEVIASVVGKGAFGALKHESGVHRVQRVPVTESQGRIHTSTVTVAVLPEAEEVDVTIDEARDLRIDVYRAGGPGGQHVNTTDSAVRITHLPTGVVVTCQDEKSQHKNKARAMKILRSRLLEHERQRKEAERAQARRGQIGTGDRSERIRTYNYPQNRVTDHRINLTLHRLDAVLEGDLDELVEQCAAQFRARELEGGAP